MAKENEQSLYIDIPYTLKVKIFCTFAIEFRKLNNIIKRFTN